MVDRYDYIVVGSGAGGAALSYELSKSGGSVLVLEKGIDYEGIGGKENASKYIDKVKSLEGINIMRAIMAGGTTVISAGNILRCLEDELREIGIDLSCEFSELEDEIGAQPLPKELLSRRSILLQEAAGRLGYCLEPMPKCLDLERCDGCGLCMAGCSKGLKWTSRVHLEKALENGATVEYGTDVQYVDSSDSALTVCSIKGSREVEHEARNVILAAGALTTPVILQHSGIADAGHNLSVDLLKHVYGFIPNEDFGLEPPMSMVGKGFLNERGFIISPNINPSVIMNYIRSQDELFPYHLGNSLGVMIKIRDCPNGRVFPDGSVSKDVVVSDLEKFSYASEVIRRIMIEAGADKRYIFESHINGAHPNGTAAIGQIVDKHLMTSVEGLYVCDASVFPKVPGLPPMLTIMALAKRLGAHLRSMP